MQSTASTPPSSLLDQAQPAPLSSSPTGVATPIETHFTTATPVDLPGLVQSLQHLSQQQGSTIQLQIDTLTIQGLRLQITPSPQPAGNGQPTAPTTMGMPLSPPVVPPTAPVTKRQLTPVMGLAPVVAPPQTLPLASSNEEPATAVVHQSTHPNPSTPDLTTVLNRLRQLVADILYVEDTSALGNADKFVDHGMDSVTGVAFINKINRTFDLKLKAVMLYDYATLNDMAAYILSQLQAQAAMPTGSNGTAPTHGAQPQMRDLLSKVANRELTPQASRQQLERLAHQLPSLSTPSAASSVADTHTVTAAIRQQLVEIQPDLAARPLVLTATFDELGFDSVEQAEVIVKTMERLGIELPRVDFAYAKTVGEVVEKLVAKSAHNRSV